MATYDDTIRRRALDLFEAAIIRGFIVSNRRICGCACAIKGFNSNDIDYFHSRFRNDPIVRVVLSLYSVNGIIVYDPTYSYEQLKQVIDFVRAMPDVFLKAVITESNSLLAIYREVLPVFHQYVDSDESRSLWSDFKAAQFDRARFTGDSCLTHAPFSSEFISWARFHRDEDRRQEHEILWGFTRLLLNFANPKAGRGLPDHWYSRRPQMAVENQIIDPIRTNEDLVAQMIRLVNNEEDAHDKIVRGIEEQWVKEAEVEQQKLEAKMAERRDLDPSELVSSSWHVVPIEEGRKSQRGGRRRI